MKIRLKEGSTEYFGLRVGTVYEAAEIASVVREDGSIALAATFGVDDEDPYRDGQGDYWVAHDPTLSFPYVCVAAASVEVVE